MKLANEFEETKFTHIYRDKNNFADVLATLALMTHINIRSKFQPISIKLEISKLIVLTRWKTIVQ
jgi:hypothetical protein